MAVITPHSMNLDSLPSRFSMRLRGRVIFELLSHRVCEISIGSFAELSSGWETYSIFRQWNFHAANLLRWEADGRSQPMAKQFNRPLCAAKTPASCRAAAVQNVSVEIGIRNAADSDFSDAFKGLACSHLGKTVC